MNEKNKALLAELVRGAEACFSNAEQLIQEAFLLREHKHFQRAVFLHQISMEECAKVDMIGAWVTMVLGGHDLDMNKLTKEMRDHKEKNFTNAYMAKVSDAEKAAKDNNDMKGAVEAFTRWQKEIHTFLNDAKNASMYVDFKNGKFISPTEVVAEEGATAFAALNYYFMTVTGPRIRAMQRMLNEPERSEEMSRYFEERLIGLRKERPDLSLNDLSAAVDGVLREMLEKYLKEAPKTKQ